MEEVHGYTESYWMLPMGESILAQKIEVAL
jgi:hypothetical protein